MRKLKKISSSYSDVLIIDANGSDFILQCLPKKYSSRVLTIRGEAPIIFSLGFFLILVRMIIRFGPTPLALISSIIQYLGPLAVITFIDNISIMGKLSNLFPDCLVISVQNGVRFKGDWYQDYKLPTYFGFGEYERELIKDSAVHVDEYQAVGSLKMGLFLSELGNYERRPDSNGRVCFISQYRHNMLGSDDQPWYEKFFSYNREVFVDLVNWSKENNFQLDVAMVSSRINKNFDNEINYFKGSVDCSNVCFHPKVQESFSSYNVCINAEVLVAVDSTLGFEMFGYGKKILFCGAMNDSFMSVRGSFGLFEKMPKFVLLKEEGGEQESLNWKLSNLLTMSDKEYLDATKSARSYYMSNGQKYPHEIISDCISSFISGQSK